MNVNFHIGRLTIEGRTRADGLRLSDALRHRLAESAAAGLAVQPGSIEYLDAGTLPHGLTAEHTGRHLADQILRRVKGSRDA